MRLKNRCEHKKDHIVSGKFEELDAVWLNST